MTKECKYEIIEGIKSKKSFLLVSDFKAKKSNRIITNLIEKIEEYEKAREIETKYNKKILENGEEKILGTDMKSKDGVIRGIIYYEHLFMGTPLSNLGAYNGSVKAKFNFNSNNEVDKAEYRGLVKLIKAM